MYSKGRRCKSAVLHWFGELVEYLVEGHDPVPPGLLEVCQLQLKEAGAAVAGVHVPSGAAKKHTSNSRYFPIKKEKSSPKANLNSVCRCPHR